MMQKAIKIEEIKGIEVIVMAFVCVMLNDWKNPFYITTKY